MSKRPSEGKKTSKDATSKRSKGAGSFGASISAPALPRFIDDEAADKYHRYVTPLNRQKIVPCFYLERERVEPLGLSSVLEIFGDLQKFMFCNDKICEELIWEFYANLECPGISLTTRVDRKNIEFSDAIINAAFGYKTDRSFVNPFYAHSWPENDYCGLDIKEMSLRYFKVTWTKDIETKVAYKPKNLDALPRVVYELMWLLLVPSSGHSSEPTIGQILLFFAIMEGKKIDYASYLRHYIALVANGTTKKDLPCGNIIMKVLKHVKIRNPSSPSFLECTSVQPNFFTHKRVQYDRVSQIWRSIRTKNPRPRNLLEGQGTQGQGAGSSSQAGNIEDIVKRSIQSAVDPLVAQIEKLQLALEEEKTRHAIFRDKVSDEFDVMRQATLTRMERTECNRIIRYRGELETSRIARWGDAGRNARNEQIEPEDDDGSSSSRTPSEERSRASPHT